MFRSSYRVITLMVIFLIFLRLYIQKYNLGLIYRKDNNEKIHSDVQRVRSLIFSSLKLKTVVPKLYHSTNSFAENSEPIRIACIKCYISYLTLSLQAPTCH